MANQKLPEVAASNDLAPENGIVPGRRIARSRALGLTLLALLPAIIPLVHAMFSYSFGGDGGERLDKALDILPHPHTFTTRLPVLQMHIALFYSMKPPVWAYRLIPFSYFVLALLSIARICLRVFPRGFAGLLATSLILFSVSLNQQMQNLSFGLYQEILFFGLLYFWIWLRLTHRHPVIQSLTLIVAVLTREYMVPFIVSWLAFTAIFDKNNVKREALTAAPALLATFLWEVFIFRTPIRIGPIAAPENAARLFAVMTNVHIAATAFALLPVIPLAYLSLRQRPELRLLLLSGIASVAMMYVYIFVYDPWGKPPLNTRQIFPLAAFLPLFAIIIGAAYFEAQSRLRFLFIVFLIPALVSEMRLPKLPLGHDPSREAYDALSSIVSSYDSAPKPIVCSQGFDYWKGYVQYVVPPFLYFPRKAPIPKAAGPKQKKEGLEHCELLFYPEKVGPPGFEPLFTIHTDEHTELYLLRRLGTTRVEAAS